MRNKMPLYTQSRSFEKLPNRIEALQIFWQSFFHDIRKKIMGMVNLCDLPARPSKSDGQLMSVKTIGRSAIHLMDKMWQDISLDLAAIKTTPSLFLLHTWSKDLIRIFKLLHELPGNEVKLTIQPGLKQALIQTDELLLTQVITHLLGNAFKLSEPGTVIELSCKEQEGSLVIEVSHDGILPEQYREVIFMPYLCGEDYSYNIGLGLYLCRVYISAMGGLIEAKSLHDTTTFAVTLPGIIKQHGQDPNDI